MRNPHTAEKLAAARERRDQAVDLTHLIDNGRPGGYSPDQLAWMTATWQPEDYCPLDLWKVVGLFYEGHRTQDCPCGRQNMPHDKLTEKNMDHQHGDELALEPTTTKEMIKLLATAVLTMTCALALLLGVALLVITLIT